MSVEIKFESNQDYQTEAIESVTGLFEGAPKGSLGVLASSNHSVVAGEDSWYQDLVHSNRLPGSIEFAELVQSNLRKIQDRTRTSSNSESLAIVPEGMRKEFESGVMPRDFSIEMETGTGKTYVYLRTAIELYLQFGLSKYVIVVPSVAIREGVLSSLRLMKEHFKELYSGLQFDSYVYESKNVTKLRQFATSSHLQILVMNIAAFNSDYNVIRRQTDALNGQAPIDFIQAVQPVVIMDEPQKLSGDSATKAIEDLNSSFRLRYSATHKDHHHLVYRLTPVDAYELKLVKRIDVLSVTAAQNKNVPLVTVKRITSSAQNVTATLEINKTGVERPVQVSVKKNSDLQELSGMQIYQGWGIEDIKANSDDEVAHVLFSNGQILREGSSSGVEEEAWQRARIRAAIMDHFDTEMLVKLHVTRGTIEPLKNLTLFFIDRVANYAPNDGKFRIWFEEEYLSVSRLGKYRNLAKTDVSKVHGGYFAVGRDGPKDSTERGSKDDEVAYDLIMKNKDKLLSFETDMKFIFSHSALAEGWDNPNVFTICNLQNVQSTVKRRQQVGRGLRLPVMTNGERCRVEEVNHLTIIAPESYADFASKLQRDIEEETGVVFTGHIGNKEERVTNEVKLGSLEDALFLELWKQISPKTSYRLTFSTIDLIDEAVLRLKTEPTITPPSFTIVKQEVDNIGEAGLVGGQQVEYGSIEISAQIDKPDILGEVVAEVPVTRVTVKKVIEESGRLAEANTNPAMFITQVARSIRRALAATIKNKDGIAYTPIDERYEAKLFLNEQKCYERNLVPVNKSIYAKVPVDSNVEREFVTKIDLREDILLFIKLPDWYKVATPVGGYNPDWAIVKKSDADELELYLVRETKGTSDMDDWFREAEAWKVKFGSKHYEALGVDYKVVQTADEIDADRNPQRQQGKESS